MTSTKTKIIGIVKVIAFIISVRFAKKLIFIPLSAFSSRYWSKYDGRGLNEPWYLSSTITILLVTVALCFIFLKYFDKKGWSYIRFKIEKKLKYFSGSAGVSFLLVLIFVLAAVLSNSIEIAISKKSVESIVFYLLVAFIGIFALVLSEEIIARGYVLRTLETHFNKAFAIIVSSILFSLFHILRPNTSILGFLNIFLMGCLLSVLCIYFKSLWVPIGLHFGWNYSLFFYNFPISGHQYPHQLFHMNYLKYSLISGTKFGPEDSLIVTVFLMLFLAYFFKKFKLNAFAKT